MRVVFPAPGGASTTAAFPYCSAARSSGRIASTGRVGGIRNVRLRPSISSRTNNMRSDSGTTQSVWMTTADVPLYGLLTESTQANVCVIGAGIAGLSTAYLLAREGKSVVVLDDGLIGGGESGRTTAHLSVALDRRYHQI